MRVTKILSKILGPCVLDVDRRIARTLSSAVETAVRVKRLSLTCLGRGLRSQAKPKHNIKRIDRLLGNRSLWASMEQIYGAVAAAIIRRAPRIVVLVDWTDSECESFVVLSASIASQSGRAMVIRNEIYRVHQLSNGRIERRFLRRLHKQLPPETHVTVVTDAGFRIAFFRQARKLGWDFVGRISRQMLVGPADSEAMARVDQALFPLAKTKPKSMGLCHVTQSHRFPANVVVVKKKSKGRHGSPHETRKRSHPGTPAFEKYRRRGREPWVLATSLDSANPDRVVYLYSLRMQIEQCFRDAKNQRFGLALQNVRSSNPERIAVLFLIAALASFLATLVGTAAEQASRHRHFQANTIARRRVLSRFVLGLLVLAGKPHDLPKARQIRQAIQGLAREASTHFST